MLDGVDTATAIATLEGAGVAVVPSVEAALDRGFAQGDRFVFALLPEDGGLGGKPPALQLAMTGGIPRLPLALGSLGGAAVRDVVVYTLTDGVPVAPTLARLSGDGDCLVERERPSLDDDLADAWHRRTDGLSVPHYSREAWLPDGRCRDCEWQDRALPRGVSEALGGGDSIGRMRVRYHRDRVENDPLFSVVDEPLAGHKRIVRYRWELESTLPRCDGEPVDGPGTCFTGAWWARRAYDDPGESEHLDQTHRGGCGPSRVAVLLLPLVLAGLRRRP